MQDEPQSKPFLHIPMLIPAFPLQLVVESKKTIGTNGEGERG